MFAAPVARVKRLPEPLCVLRGQHQCSFGLLKLKLEVTWIKFDQQIASLTGWLSVMWTFATSRHFWTDLNDMTIDKSVVSRFMRPRIEQVATANYRTNG